MVPVESLPFEPRTTEEVPAKMVPVESLPCEPRTTDRPQEDHVEEVAQHLLELGSA